MTPRPDILMTTLLTFVLLAGFSAALTCWSCQNGGSVWKCGERFVREHRRYRRLSDEQEAIARCSRGKVQVVAGVVAGTLSLEQAVERFDSLEAEKERVLGPVPDSQRSRGELARYQSVVAWVLHELRHKPGKDPAEVKRRIAAEFQARFGPGAGLLPAEPWRRGTCLERPPEK